MFRPSRDRPLCKNPAVTEIKSKSPSCSSSSLTTLTTILISPLLMTINVVVGRPSSGQKLFNHINKCRKSPSLMTLTSVPQAPAHPKDTKAKNLSSMTYKTILSEDRAILWMKHLCQVMCTTAKRIIDIALGNRRTNNTSCGHTGTMSEELTLAPLSISEKPVMHILNTLQLCQIKTHLASKIRFIKGFF